MGIYWDIIGGISGICWAKRHIITDLGGIISINLLFNYEDTTIKITSPYGQNDILSLKLREYRNIRIRLSSLIDQDALLEEINEKKLTGNILGNWLYLTHIPVGNTIKIRIPFLNQDKWYTFKNHKLCFRWHGDSVIGATSSGKRLCFFPEIQE
jgi:hypothetical protein